MFSKKHRPTKLLIYNNIILPFVQRYAEEKKVKIKIILVKTGDVCDNINLFDEN